MIICRLKAPRRRRVPAALFAVAAASILPGVRAFAQQTEPPAPVATSGAGSPGSGDKDPALAALATLSPGLTITPGLSAAEYHDFAVQKLRGGCNFERAILELREAVRQEPDSRAYQIAFGCALASRAAALGNAASHLGDFAKDQAKFKERLTAWETAQNDRTSPLYRKPRPLPPVLRTKDDKKPFTLTPDEAANRFAPLALAALAAWDKAVALAKADAERAETHWYRGWGLFVLRGFGKSVGVDAIKNFPEFSEVAKAFEAATEAAPNDARYWQSLGDVFLNHGFNPGFGTGAVGTPEERAQRAQNGVKRGVDAYQRAAGLDKRNALLWYRLYELWRQEDLMRAKGLYYNQENSEQAEAALRQAAHLDSGNAFPVYHLAGLRLHKTAYNLFEKELGKAVDNKTPLPPRDQTTARVLAALTDEKRAEAREAIAQIEQGNRAPRYTLPIYRPAAPPLLGAAWNLRRHLWLRETWWDFGVWDDLTNTACDFAQVTAKEGNGDEAVRVTQAVAHMGERFCRAVQEDMRPGDGILLCAWLSGIVAGTRAYDTQASVCEMLGDSDGAAAARKAMDGLRALNGERQTLVYGGDGYGDY